MPRKTIQRLLPDPERIKSHKNLSLLGNWLQDPNIWHLNRNSVAAATFIGCFVAFIPLPGQMIIAAVLAIIFRANLPISVSLVWISNPFTMPPLFYMAYKIGAAVMSVDTEAFTPELSLDWIINGLANSLEPFLLGCLLCGLFFGLLGSTTVRWLWRRHTIKRWHNRRLNRENTNPHS